MIRVSDVADVLEVVVLDELDFDVPCQHTKAAGEPADWALKCRACGNVAVMLCDEHLLAIRRDEATVLATARAFGGRPEFGDMACGFKAGTIDEAFEVVRVR
jgi:hypothetical protein